MKRSRAQAALEYVFIVGLAFSLIIPVFYLFYEQSNQMTGQVYADRIADFGQDAIRQGRLIYFTGNNSRTIVDIDMPQGVKNFSVYNSRELIITVEIEGRDQELLFFTDGFNISAGRNCSSKEGYIDDPSFYSPGVTELIVESCGDKVLFRSRR